MSAGGEVPAKRFAYVQKLVRRKRKQRGCVALVRRAKGEGAWMFRWTETGHNGKAVRRAASLGTLQDYPTRADVEPIAKEMRERLQLSKGRPNVLRYIRRRGTPKKLRCSDEQYKDMVIDQLGRCAICNITPPRLCADHDHETGANRGLLCPNCNLAIGLFADNPMLLRAAASYLDEHNQNYRRKQPEAA